MIVKMGQNGFSAVGSLFSDSLLGRVALLNERDQIVACERENKGQSRMVLTCAKLAAPEVIPMAGVRL